MIDTKILHARIAGEPRDFLRELFGEEVKPAGPDKWRVGRRGSLAITIREGMLVFYSHEEGQGGDAVALWQRERGGGVGEAIKAAAAWAGMSDDGAAKSRSWSKRAAAIPRERRTQRYDPRLEAEAMPVAPVQAKTGEDPRMTDAEFAEAHQAASLLAGDRELCGAIAEHRGWKEETVFRLALEGSLGWSVGWPGMHTTALVFVYYGGIKHRWVRDGKRMIRWYCGGPRTFWREAEFFDQKEIFITEGETDAITMINAGIEESRQTLVVALPNAGAVPWNLVEFVRGREVTLSLDNDDAGRAARDKMIALIQPVVSQLKIWKAQ